MKPYKIVFALASIGTAISVLAADHGTGAVGDDVIKAQNAALAAATEGKGFWPPVPA